MRHVWAGSRLAFLTRWAASPVYCENPIGAHRLCDVLYLLFPHVLEVKLELLLHVVVDMAGDADTAWLRQDLKPCRDVDAVSEQLALLDEHVAQVDANTEAHASCLRQVGIALRQLPLHFHGAAHRIHRTGKLGQDGIAGSVDHPAPVLLDEIGKDVAVGVQSVNDGVVVVAHQAAVAHHVGDKNRGQFAFGFR